MVDPKRALDIVREEAMAQNVWVIAAFQRGTDEVEITRQYNDLMNERGVMVQRIETTETQGNTIADIQMGNTFVDTETIEIIMGIGQQIGGFRGAFVTCEPPVEQSTVRTRAVNA